MEGVLWPASLTVRYVPLYEVSQQLCFAVQKAAIRGIGAVASGARASIIFHGQFSLYERVDSQHPLLSLYRDVLCSHRSGWPRAHLAFVIRDSFVPARNKRETRPLTPCSPTHPRRAATLHDRVGSTLPISSRRPRLSFAPSCPHMRLNQKFFSSGFEITELSRLFCLAFMPTEFCTRQDSASLYATFIWYGNAYGWLHAKLFYVI